MNKDWNSSAWEMVMRVIWLAVVIGGLIIGLRLMSWADEGIRDLEGGNTKPVQSWPWE